MQYTQRCQRIMVLGALMLLTASLQAQEADTSSTLTIPQIMADPLTSVGSLPGEDINWSEDSRQIYFSWNPEHADADSLYVVSREGGEPRKLTPAERAQLPAFGGAYNRAYSARVYAKDGDLFLQEVPKGKIRRLTETIEVESDPVFTHDEEEIVFTRERNLYAWRRTDGLVRQITDFRSGNKPREETEPENANDRWLKQEEAGLIKVLRERREQEERAKRNRRAAEPARPRKIYLGDQRVEAPRLSPDERYVTFRLVADASGVRRTNVPDYVREDGYTGEMSARPKVGSPQDHYQFGIYDIKADTVYYAPTDSLPGIYERPDDLAPGDSLEVEQKKARSVILYGPYWSDNGAHALMVGRAADNKDRWILLLDPADGALRVLGRQHDEAWIGGPGISGWIFYPGNVGWMPDNRRVWFQSEISGYSHLYTVDIHSGERRALTSGKFEVSDARLSRDRKQWYLTTNEVHPGERHFYRMPLEGGPREQITRRPGHHQVFLSPDEMMLAVRYSYSNQPWQLFLMPNRPGASMKQVTSALSEQFKQHTWRDPQIVRFEARDGQQVYARLYRPANPQPQGPAVIFVHGAGYLQNAHKWWSDYFREYMFNNFLADHGYTVLDIDYRASAGYGRDWRTAIYRDMGGKDLGDQLDGAAFLAAQYEVDPGRIGIYGGSYGGFITFMALFTEPEVFACGAALRPVSDWAHYNHPYTANILNQPQSDSLAYRRSSPIYHAEGLAKPLLICHGMIDTNVHFQDVVRLAQRLIELGKADWELAVYPLEGHGFREPSSWSDEYRRIFKLFQRHLK